MRRPRLNHFCAWWPDQIVGALIATTALRIVLNGSAPPIALAWVALVGIAGAATIVSVHLRRDAVTAAALFIAGAGLAGCVVGSDARSSMAFAVAAIYLWERARVHASLARLARLPK